MLNFRRSIFIAGILLAIASFAAAQDSTTNSPPRPGGGSGTNAIRTRAPKQADLASKTATFGKIAKNDEACKTALDAHALVDAHKLVDKDGAFKGTVSMTYEPHDGSLAILDFDANYRNALTAVLRKENFTNFPALTNLVGKDVLISGKFIDYQGRAEIVLTNVTQVKLVE